MRTSAHMAIVAHAHAHAHAHAYDATRRGTGCPATGRALGIRGSVNPIMASRSFDDRRFGRAAKNLDWLSSDPQAPAVPGGAAESKRDLGPRVVVSADVGVHGRDELLDGRG